MDSAECLDGGIDDLLAIGDGSNRDSSLAAGYKLALGFGALLTRLDLVYDLLGSLLRDIVDHDLGTAGSVEVGVTVCGKRDGAVQV